VAWLSHVKTGRARSKIRHYLKTAHHDESTALGEKMLNQELRALGVVASELPVSSWKNVLRDSGNKLIKEVYTDIGLGFRLAGVVARRLLAREDTPQPADKSPASLVIRGTEGMAVQFAPCCQPIPGDPIIGSIWKGKGLVIHTHDCPAIRKARSAKPTKWIDVEWEPEPGKLFSVRLLIMVQNTVGALGRIATEISTFRHQHRARQYGRKASGTVHHAAFYGAGRQSHFPGASDAQRASHSRSRAHYSGSGALCLKVLVIGAGVVGVTSAWYLAKAGHQVTVLDRQPPPDWKPALPMAARFQSRTPNRGPTRMPRCVPWPGCGARTRHCCSACAGMRPCWTGVCAFCASARTRRTRDNMRQIVNLALYSRRQLQALRAETSLAYDHLERGILHVYTDRREFAAPSRPRR
jgi:hypothetical protein